MEDIRKVFTIQWVGPFDTFTSLSEYLNDPNTCDCHLFSFYYCPGSKKGKGHPISKDDYRYFGLHRSGTPIHTRVAPWHEHLETFENLFLYGLVVLAIRLNRLHKTLRTLKQFSFRHTRMSLQKTHKRKRQHLKKASVS